VVAAKWIAFTGGRWETDAWLVFIYVLPKLQYVGSSLCHDVNGALIGVKLPKFRDNLSVPSSRVKHSNCLTFEGGTDRLPRRVGDLLRIDVA